MNILYIHGFASGGKSSTSSLLEYKLKEDNIQHPDIPSDPREALPFIEKYIKENDIDIIIGTSLGGLYAHQFQIPKIIINPGFNYSIEIGTHEFYVKREDDSTHFEITNEMNDYLKTLTNKSNTAVKDQSFYFIGINDTVISPFECRNWINENDEILYIEMEHRIDEDNLDNYIIPYIEILKSKIK